jgi:2,3,4,5-tetrahydropyridine-2-carboxylate N-succinyltransferase
LRVAEPVGEGWQVNEWVKKAVVNSLSQKMEIVVAGISGIKINVVKKRFMPKKNESA